MSIRFLVLLSVFSLFGCKTKIKKTLLNEFDKAKSDSIAKYYDSISNHFYQPSLIHSVYKDSAILYQSDNADLIKRLSYSYKKTGNHLKAMEILNKAVALDIEFGKTDVLEYKAWSLLYFYRDYAGAIADIAQIEKMSGESHNPCWGEPCRFLKGQALYQLKQYNEAIEAFNSVNEEEGRLGLEPEDNFLVFFYIGRCYAEKKEFKKALENFNKSLKGVYSLFPEAYYQMGLIYKVQGNSIKAKKCLEKALELKSYKLNEPFIERFDEVFPYMIEREISYLK